MVDLNTLKKRTLLAVFLPNAVWKTLYWNCKQSGNHIWCSREKIKRTAKNHDKYQFNNAIKSFWNPREMISTSLICIHEKLRRRLVASSKPETQRRTRNFLSKNDLDYLMEGGGEHNFQSYLLLESTVK